MDTRRNSITKYIILAAVFMATSVLTFISMNFEAASVATTTMTQATLPVVMMQTEEGGSYNRLCGYTNSTDGISLTDTLTPLPTDKKLPIVIDEYDQKVKAVSYKVRDMDMSLIESTEVSDFYEENGQVNAVLNIKNLIEKNTQYLLEIILSTEKHETISYYTTIICGGDYQLQKKINFVLEFHENTYDAASLANIQKYIETNSSGNNTNYGNVDIHSKQSTIGWGDLTPFVESDVIPSVQSVDDEVAVITLNYMVGAENDYDSYDTYRVEETFRIRQSGSNMYLLDYKRKANQVFDGINDLTSSSKIMLGIRSDTSVVYSASENGVHTVFVDNGSLWSFDADNSVFTRIFSFRAEDSDNIRESNDDMAIKIMKVEDDGSCRFLVYGYMSRGEHEGELGISLCSYSYAENTVTEEIYIPTPDMSYGEMKDKVGGIAYVNDNSLFYILVDDTLYAINLISKEVMVEVSGLADGCYAVSSDADTIAYSISGKLYDTDAIRIIDMEQGVDHIISADEGEKLRVLGYINEDLIYGIANASDIEEEENGEVFFPMYQINIIDSEFNMLKEYNEPDIFVSDASVNSLRVNLYRVRKNEDGSYERISMDQLINREENSGSSSVYVDTISTDARKTEVVMIPGQSASDTENTVVRVSDKVIFKKDETFRLEK